MKKGKILWSYSAKSILLDARSCSHSLQASGSVYNVSTSLSRKSHPQGMQPMAGAFPWTVSKIVWETIASPSTMDVSRQGHLALRTNA